MRARLFAVGLISATSLMWEVALTRLFSVVLQYHYVFLAVSLAVLGLGIGAVVLAAVSSSAQARRERATDAGSAGVPPVLVYLCSALAVTLPLAALLISGMGNLESVALYALLALVPFALAGVVTSALFALSPGRAGRLYGADLLGAGLGTAAVVVLLNLWGGVGVALALGPLAGLAALALAWPSPLTRDRRALGAAGTSVVLTVALVVANLLTPLAQLNLSGGAAAPPDKTMLHLLADTTQRARVVWTRWDAFARTDVVRTTDQSTMLMFTDGGAGSAIYRFNGDIATMAGLRGDLPYLPYQVAAGSRPRPRKVLIIGPGGGYDVLLARLAGASDITAVEINGAEVAAVRHFGAYDGHLYDLPGVHVVVGDGRNVLRRSHERYDLIVLRLVYSQAAEAASHALAENYVFTSEAFRDYLAHLAPGGLLAVTGHQALEALRAFITGIDALQASGVPQMEAMKQVAALMTGTNDPQSRPSLMLLKNGIMTARETGVLQANRTSLNLQPLYVPYLYPGQFNKLANGSESLSEFLSGGSDYSVGPTSDDQPFFFEFNPGLPDAVGGTLALAVALSLIIILAGALARLLRRAPAARAAARGPARRGAGKASGGARLAQGSGEGEARPFWPLVPYFALLGLAFMLAEVSLIQRFILLLGQPVVALVAVLGSLLIGAGLGSLASGGVVAGQPRRLAGLIALLAALLVGAVYVLPPLIDALVPLDLSLRLLATAVLLAPLGCGLGMLFPSGMALAGPRAAPGDIAFLWAINAATSVLGSALAVALAVLAGFSVVLWLAALSYLCAGLVVLVLRRTVQAADRPKEQAGLAVERQVVARH